MCICCENGQHVSPGEYNEWGDMIAPWTADEFSSASEIEVFHKYPITMVKIIKDPKITSKWVFVDTYHHHIKCEVKHCPECGRKLDI